MDPQSNKPDIEKMRPEDSNFIPEIELDPRTGEPKKKPYTQKPYEPLSDYGA